MSARPQSARRREKESPKAALRDSVPFPHAKRTQVRAAWSGGPATSHAQEKEDVRPSREVTADPRTDPTQYLLDLKRKRDLLILELNEKKEILSGGAEGDQRQVAYPFASSGAAASSPSSSSLFSSSPSLAQPQFDDDGDVHDADMYAQHAAQRAELDQSFDRGGLNSSQSSASVVTHRPTTSRRRTKPGQLKKKNDPVSRFHQYKATWSKTRNSHHWKKKIWER
jgi:hypothetical protein